MIRFVLKLAPIRFMLRVLLSLFYDTKYLRGYYFDNKVLGWFWALRGLPCHLYGDNRGVPWPVHPRTIVSGSGNISFESDSLNVFSVPGCYWQAFDGKIIIGHDCHVAPNVGVITTNHDIYNPSEHAPGKDVVIGDSCWIGMNAVILPGVKLGNHTVVAAGAVVTKSFPDGNCVIGGVPAKVLKRL